MYTVRLTVIEIPRPRLSSLCSVTTLLSDWIDCDLLTGALFVALTNKFPEFNIEVDNGI